MWLKLCKENPIIGFSFQMYSIDMILHECANLVLQFASNKDYVFFGEKLIKLFIWLQLCE